MKNLASILALIGLCLSSNLTKPLMSQTKEGFYDNNDYDMRNIPGYDPEGNILQDVDQPPSFQTPALVTPKDVRTKYDPTASIPGAGAQLQSTQAVPANNQYQSATTNALSKSPINPLTGELNPAALQNQNNRSRNKKEIQKKLRQEFDEEAVYEETKFRRGYIIFFLTLPFALGVSAGIASVMVVTKELTGSLIMIFGTGGLAGTNVYLDQERLEESRKNKAKLKPTEP
jgi:hypothetical protein